MGLGYVGLPLAIEFGKKREVIGFDTNIERIKDLKSGLDKTNEVNQSDLAGAKFLSYHSDDKALSAAQIYIVTVPTPIDDAKKPDLGPLISASKTIGKHLTAGNIVIYESTVYPGATESVCVPILEEMSGLKFNTDFYCGYSPERINPGDKEHRLPNIIKVTSGSTPEVADEIDQLYKSIITAGTHKAQSIKIAEAAKVIENTQRDLNIAFINELSQLFQLLNIDTSQVLEAAGTKWNFLNFKPGLVGGHCIGVDPYYLTHKAQEIGFHPQIILAGRQVNDGMGKFIATTMVQKMAQEKIIQHETKILILGLAFKENCPDLRNTKVIDVVTELEKFGITVDVSDSLVDPAEAKKEYGINLVAQPETSAYDGVILAVPHATYIKSGIHVLKSFGKEDHVFFDVKNAFPSKQSDIRL